MINNVTICGRLTKDVDLRYSQNGKAVANFTVASNRPFKNNGQQEADFINTVQFGRGAELTAQYMSKGSLVGVQGRIQTRNYENNEGKRIFVTEVVAEQVAFMESKNSNTSQSQTNNSKPNTNTSGGSQNDSDPFKNNGEPINITDDDLPF